MAVSRNPVEFLRRQGMVQEPARPRPRFDVQAARVHTMPITTPPGPSQAVLESLEGNPPPDRGVSRPWPGQVVEAG